MDRPPPMDRPISMIFLFNFLIRVLGIYGLKINPHKNVAIVRLVDKALPTFIKRWTNRSTKGLMLHLPDSTMTVPNVALL